MVRGYPFRARRTTVWTGRFSCNETGATRDGTARAQLAAIGVSQGGRITAIEHPDLEAVTGGVTDRIRSRNPLSGRHRVRFRTGRRPGRRRTTRIRLRISETLLWRTSIDCSGRRPRAVASRRPRSSSPRRPETERAAEGGLVPSKAASAGPRRNAFAVELENSAGPHATRSRLRSAVSRLGSCHYAGTRFRYRYWRGIVRP